MRVLAFDTSTALGTAAVLVEGTLCSEASARVENRHGDALLPLLEDVLDRAQVGRRDLDLIVVGLGPGSFTGTRIGVATAKGLALGTGAPVVGVVTLRVLALGLPGEWVAPAVDAHKGEVYFALYHRRPAGLLAEPLAPRHRAPEEAAAILEAHCPSPFVTAGSAHRRYAERFRPAGAQLYPALYDEPRAALLALEGERAFRRRGPDDLAALEPLYLRPSDAVLPVARPTRRPGL